MRIRWVKVWVDAMASLTERFRDEEGRVDFEALGREEYAFRHALVTGDFSRSERARDLYDATINEITSRSEAGRKGAEARWSKKTAAATTREGVDESTTGCNNSQVAPTSNAGDESSDASNGAALKSATACNSYDQEALDKPTISANSPAGAGVNFDSTQTIRPDASSGNAEGVNTNGSTITRNVSRATRTSATSGQTIEALDKPGAGEVPHESASAKPSPALPVPSKRPHGEFGNVMLTDDEYIKACASIQDCDSMIERMSSYKASSGKKYKSDYAALLNWARRDDDRHSMPQAPMYKTAADRDREEIQKIADYYAAQERGEKPPMPKIQLMEGL